MPSFLPRKSAGIRVPSLNLYPEDPFYDSLIGKTLKWSVTIGRHIVIFTEVVVIVSFLSRFVLDRQLSDLNRDILAKQSIVESYGTLETDFRELQQKAKDIQSILDKQGKYTVLEKLSDLTPPGEVRYEQVSLANDRLGLEGVALSNRSLSQLVDGLRGSSTFQNVSINNVQSGENNDPSIYFTLSMQIRSQGAGIESLPTAPVDRGAKTNSSKGAASTQPEEEL
jgi:Tfp pilus assembly protein PilN